MTFLFLNPLVQMVKILPAGQETQVRSLGQEGLLEKGIANYSSILAWRIPWIEEQATVREVTESETTEQLTLLYSI